MLLKITRNQSPESIKRSLAVAGVLLISIYAIGFYAGQFKLALREQSQMGGILIASLLFSWLIVTPILWKTIGPLRVIAISPLLMVGPVVAYAIFIACAFSFIPPNSHVAELPVAGKSHVRSTRRNKRYAMLAEPIPNTDYVKIRVPWSVYEALDPEDKVRVRYEVGRFGLVNIQEVKLLSASNTTGPEI